jgi:hypothetical protein
VILPPLVFLGQCFQCHFREAKFNFEVFFSPKKLVSKERETRFSSFSFSSKTVFSYLKFFQATVVTMGSFTQFTLVVIRNQLLSFKVKFDFFQIWSNILKIFQNYKDFKSAPIFSRASVVAEL